MDKVCYNCESFDLFSKKCKILLRGVDADQEGCICFTPFKDEDERKVKRINYIEIMVKALKGKLDKDEKPDLSIKDWWFIYHCLSSLQAIVSSYKENKGDAPEYLEDDVTVALERFERLTNHEIL